MNKKVEELVEWVAKRLFKDDLHPTSQIEYEYKWAKLNERETNYWLKKAKQILSHPDLALIDRVAVEKIPLPNWENPQPQTVIQSMQIEEAGRHRNNGYFHCYNQMRREYWLPVIPLAEALEEGGQDGR